MNAPVPPPGIELHGAPTGNCLRVAVALEELGLAYAIHRVDLRGGEQRGAAFLALNPDGHVPVLVDRSDPDRPLVIGQSNAILLHLTGLKPGLLLPADDARALAITLERFFYFVTDVIAPNFSAFYLKMIGAPADVTARLSQRALNAIGASERFLRESAFMAGDRYSLADLVAVTVIDASAERIAWEDYPRLARWFREVCDRPAVRRGMTAFDPGSR